MNTALAVTVIVLIIVGIIAYGFWFGKRVNDSRIEEKENVRRERRKSVRAAAVSNYMHPRVLNFFLALQQALPSNYIVFPNVSMELLFQKSQREDLRLWGHYADICIFTSSYKPILVVDLMDYSLTGNAVHVLSQEVKDIIRTAGINVMEYTVSDSYKIEEIRKAVAKSMNPLYNK